tara:strand:+ start:76 stop:696 length:621 start_codon:yes stop_codon:yes gene_type:complete
MPTPKQFIKQAIEMDTFFDDEEPTYDEFMRYPPFDSLMKEEFSLQNMINAYREGRMVFHTKKSDVKNAPKCNFFTKERPNTFFTIYNSSPMNYDEIDPTILENTHEALMNVKLKTIPFPSQFTAIKCENLTLEQEAAFSTFVAKVLYEGTRKEQGDDGKQALIVEIFDDYHTLLTTPYLKIYQPVNTEFPSWLEKALSKLFDEAKI